MNNKRKALLFVIGTLVIFCMILGVTYAFFTGGANTTNNLSYNVSFNNNTYNFTVNLSNVSNSGGTMSLSAEDMYYRGDDVIAGSYSNQLDITFVNSTNAKTTCLYDYIWVWETGNGLSGYTKSTGAEKEYTVYTAEIGEVQLPNYVSYYSPVNVIGSGKITANANSTATKYTAFDVNFYNLEGINQQNHKGKNYKGYLTIANVKCGVTLLTDYLANDAPRSGTSAVGGSAWILTSDRTGEWRYAGKNPDNYVQFNGELWRIIGVMPNTTYCTGTYGTETECDTTKTGSLVKIIKNKGIINDYNLYFDVKQPGVGSSITTYGSNDWSDSQVMLMFNGVDYLKTAYDMSGNRLHVNYSIVNNIVKDGNGYIFYDANNNYLDYSVKKLNVPSSASVSNDYTATSNNEYNKIERTAKNQIATVKWDLYGTSNLENSPVTFYNIERNINGTGDVYTNASLPENRPIYWYGKIGLMYPSDFGYATKGGSTYDRNACLDRVMYGWNSGSYKTDCAEESYLLYTNITSSAPGSSGTTQWTITPDTGVNQFVLSINSGGYLSRQGPGGANAKIRPTLYLKPGIVITGGTGKWNDPYTISSEEYNFGSTPKKYWFAEDGDHTFPSYGGTLQTSGIETGHNAYIGQDSSKYYACATISGHEVCLSQPYTQYGLSGHTLHSSFTSAQQTSAKRAIYQAFIDAGISININNNCSAGDDYANCYVGGLSCEVGSDGYIYCDGGSGDAYCGVDSTGRADCVSY